MVKVRKLIKVKIIIATVTYCSSKKVELPLNITLWPLSPRASIGKIAPKYGQTKIEFQGPLCQVFDIEHSNGRIQI